MKLQASQSVLTNGIRVVTCPAEHVESATIGLWVGVGGRHEPKSLCGASHFIEHLLFKGTRKRSARDISQAIEGRGGSFNAFTQEEFTCYYAWTAAEHAWQTLDILLDMYRRPRFATDDVEKEREVILEEMLMCRDRPDQLVQDMLTENLWPGHPLGRPLVGMEKTLLAMRRQHLLKFKNSRYVPGNTVLAFAGRLAHEDCVREAKRRLRGIHGAPAPLFPPAPPSSARDRIAIQKKNIAQIHLALGFRTFSRHDPRRHALKILNTILGDNMSSRLFQVIREKHGMAYSIQSSFQLLADTGAMVVSAGLDCGAGQRALRLIIRELRRLKEVPPGATELRRAKEYVIGQLRLALETPAARMMWAGENLLAYGRVVPPQSVIEAIEAVTARDVQETARQVFTPDKAGLALVLPESDKTSTNTWHAQLRDL